MNSRSLSSIVESAASVLVRIEVSSAVVIAPAAASALGLGGDRGRDVRADVEAVRGDGARGVADRVARERGGRGAIADRVPQREQRVRLGLATNG